MVKNEYIIRISKRDLHKPLSEVTLIESGSPDCESLQLAVEALSGLLRTLKTPEAVQKRMVAQKLVFKEKKLLI